MTIKLTINKIFRTMTILLSYIISSDGDTKRVLSSLAGVGNLACLIPQERAAQQSVKSVVSV